MTGYVEDDCGEWWDEDEDMGPCTCECCAGVPGSTMNVLLRQCLRPTMRLGDVWCVVWMNAQQWGRPLDGGPTGLLDRQRIAPLAQVDGYEGTQRVVLQRECGHDVPGWRIRAWYKPGDGLHERDVDWAHGPDGIRPKSGDEDWGYWFMWMVVDGWEDEDDDYYAR